MIYDLDKIDFARYDKINKTFYLSIYDTVLLDPAEAEKHGWYFEKKVEPYMNYAMGGNLLDELHLKKGKKYKYIIQIIMDFSPNESYIEHIKSVNEQVIELTHGQMKLHW